jgi:beta-lactam-binding protein with PASTA domain
MKQKILQNKYFRHGAVAVLVTLVILIFTGWLLRVYTHHGNEVMVPNLVGMTMAELESRHDMADFSFIIIDSIYDLNKKKGSIAFQEPPANSKVKPVRTVYLTLVATKPEQVSMPDLRDLTHRQAMAVLETYGLKPGNMQFVPDIAVNAVLKQRYKGRDIAPGTWIEKGERIDLTIGKGGGAEIRSVPLLLGMRRSEAINAINEAFFVLGNETFEDGKDTTTARVYKQSPSYLSKGMYNTGEPIHLWYRSDKKFDFNNFLRNYREDSLNGEE